jgi:polyphosphate kinase
MVAPLYMRESLLSLIQRETESAREGKKAWILLKLNHLTDRSLIEALYQASQAGVQVDLIIRGACSLVAGHPRWSANIRAISIVDWTLEHMRAAVFGNRNHPAYYLGSADWMPANMEHQVEVFCPILDPILQAQLQQILRYQLQDKQKARIISHYQIPENTRVREQAPQQETPFYAQREIQRYLQAFHDKLSSR